MLSPYLEARYLTMRLVNCKTFQNLSCLVSKWESSLNKKTEMADKYLKGWTDEIIEESKTMEMKVRHFNLQQKKHG